MKKLNKYDLTDSELKRAYDFINAVYLKRYYDSQKNIFSNNTQSATPVVKKQQIKKAVKIQDLTPQTKSISVKEDIQKTTKKKIVTKIIEDKKISTPKKTEKKPENTTSSTNSELVKNWLIIYDYSGLTKDQHKANVTIALNEAKINGQFYAIVNSADMEESFTNKESFIKAMNQTSLSSSYAYSDFYHIARNLNKVINVLKAKQINAVLYIGHQNNKSRKIDELKKLIHYLKLNLLEYKFIIIPPDGEETCSFIGNAENSPDIICSKHTEVLINIQSFI